MVDDSKETVIVQMDIKTHRNFGHMQKTSTGFRGTNTKNGQINTGHSKSLSIWSLQLIVTGKEKNQFCFVMFCFLFF